MIVAGMICLGYYVCLCIALRRWNSTFSRFWLLAGAAFLFFDRVNLRPVFPLLFVGGMIFLLVELRIVLGMFRGREERAGFLVVLGAHVQGTKVTDSLARRLDKAAAYLETHPDTNVIVSGGQGKGEDVTESEAMASYLAAKGIAGERIIQENASTTTRENLEFSAQFIGDLEKPVGIVTNNFHMYRACMYARSLGYRHPVPVTAGCLPILFVNYMVREFFAVLKMWLTKCRTML